MNLLLRKDSSVSIRIVCKWCLFLQDVNDLLEALFPILLSQWHELSGCKLDIPSSVYKPTDGYGNRMWGSGSSRFLFRS